MPKIMYVEKQFQSKTLKLIDLANNIIKEYRQQGFSLTLRQLYYQLVARGVIPNTQRDYKRLGSIINDARLAGEVDWYAIEDRTRALQGNQHWSSPTEIIEAAIDGYKINKWLNQSYRVEAWIEKDALVGVISGICRTLDIDYFSCRGYTSASEMWKAGQRLKRYWSRGYKPLVLHLGDHDPSGIDMTRDIDDRLKLFSGGGVFVKRIALTMDQVEEHGPPPNPAKITDSRFEGYVVEYGKECWELDALEPRVMCDLIEDEVLDVRDEDLWEEACEVEREHVQVLRGAMGQVEGHSWEG